MKIFGQACIFFIYALLVPGRKGIVYDALFFTFSPLLQPNTLRILLWLWSFTAIEVVCGVKKCALSNVTPNNFGLFIVGIEYVPALLRLSAEDFIFSRALHTAIRETRVRVQVQPKKFGGGLV